MNLAASLLLFAMSALLTGALAVLVRAVMTGRTRRAHVDGDGVERRLRLEEKERALSAIRDIELDYSLKKLSDDDYHALRKQHEDRALAAIHELRRLDAAARRGDTSTASRTLFVVGLTGGLLLGATPAAEAQMGMGMGGMAAGDGSPATSAGAADVHVPTDVRVIRLDATGAMVPYPGVEVVVTVLPSVDEGEVAEPREVHVVRTDSAGTGRVDDLRAAVGETVRASVLHGGQVFYGDRAPQSGSVVIAVFESRALSADRSELSARLQTQIEVDEGAMRVQCNIAFVNRSTTALMVGYGTKPLVLPAIVPRLGDWALSRGWLPDTALKHVSWVSEPDRGRVELSEGAFVYRGMISPGETSRVRIAYILNPPDDLAQLALSAADTKVDEAVVAVQWGPRLALRVQGFGPHWGTEVEQGSERLQVLRWSDPMERGGHVSFDIVGLPVEGLVRRRVAMVGLAIVCLFFSIGLLRTRGA